jgi:hypothetical protein
MIGENSDESIDSTISMIIAMIDQPIERLIAYHRSNRSLEIHFSAASQLLISQDNSDGG